MVLLLDLGNSRLKWTSLDGVGQGACLWSAHGTSWEEAWRKLPRPQRIVAVSVVGEAREALVNDWCRTNWQLGVEYLQTTARHAGLENGYFQPQQLGVDRWAALLGAWRRFHGNLLVVDAGTALTIDAVSAEGQHLGGVIAPGLSTALRALSDTADRLAVSELEAIREPWGRSTQECVVTGVLQQAVAVVERSYHSLERELGCCVQGVICGGDAPLLLSHLSGCWEHVDDLVLRGASVLAEIGEEGV